MDKRRINVRAIIWHDDKLLAVKHRQEDGSEAPYWAIPGGGLDPFETLPDGVAREVMEETGIAAKIGRVLFMQQFTSTRPGRDEELEFFYHVENSSDFNTIDLAKTTHGQEELARIEFIDPSSEFILPSFLQTINIASYVDNVKPVYLFTDLTDK